MKTVLLIVSVFAFSPLLYSQCLQISTTTQPATCNLNDGQIALTITPGTNGNAQPPFNVNLYYVGLTETHLASYTGVTFTSITFAAGNGSLNVSGGNTFGIPSNDHTEYGSYYRVSVTSSGGGNIVCRNKTLFVTVKQTPDIQIVLDDLQPDTGTGNGAISITPTGGTSPYSFAWEDGPTTEDRTNLTAGGYEVRVTDSNGCSAHYAAVVEDGSSISLQSDGSQLFPNPSYNYFTFEVPSLKEEAVIQLYDSHGNIKYSTKGFDNSYQIPVKNLPEGNYILRAVRGAWSTSERVKVSK